MNKIKLLVGTALMGSLFTVAASAASISVDDAHLPRPDVVVSPTNLPRD